MEDMNKNMTDLFSKAKNAPVDYPVKNIAALIGGSAAVGVATATVAAKAGAGSFFNLSNIAIMLGSTFTIAAVAVVMNMNSETVPAVNSELKPVRTHEMVLNKKKIENATLVVVEENELKAAVPIDELPEVSEGLVLVEEVALEDPDPVAESISLTSKAGGGLDAFSGIQLNIGVDVYLHKGGQTGVSFDQNPELADLLDLKVRNGILYINLKDDRKKEYQQLSKNNNDLMLELTLPSLQQLTINGSGDIYSSEQIPSEGLKIQINGSGDVVLDQILPKSLQINVNGSGDVSLYAKGVSSKAEININGSGDVCTRSIDISTVVVNVNGSGDANITCTDALSVNIHGSGDVCYAGSPTVSTNRYGTGEVNNCSR